MCHVPTSRNVFGDVCAEGRDSPVGDVETGRWSDRVCQCAWTASNVTIGYDRFGNVDRLGAS